MSKEKTPSFEELGEVVQKLTQALKDIIGAAGNGRAYEGRELETLFGSDYALGYETLRRLRLPEVA